jgi:predicted HNH restriction endonuclease
MDFATDYGADIGEDFIHVHHLVPIHKRGRSYEVNPETGMKPVCPNCHAMIHRRDPPFSIDELREKMIAKQKEGFTRKGH